jgi:hypothetical protein
MQRTPQVLYTLTFANNSGQIVSTLPVSDELILWAQVRDSSEVLATRGTVFFRSAGVTAERSQRARSVKLERAQRRQFSWHRQRRERFERPRNDDFSMLVVTFP